MQYVELLLCASLSYFLTTKLFVSMFFVCLFSCFVCFLFSVFCVFVLFCGSFLLLYIAVSFFFLQVYLPLPPGGNPIAVNKYHTISRAFSI